MVDSEFIPLSQYGQTSIKTTMNTSKLHMRQKIQSSFKILKEMDHLHFKWCKLCHSDDSI